MIITLQKAECRPDPLSQTGIVFQFPPDFEFPACSIDHPSLAKDLGLAPNGVYLHVRFFRDGEERLFQCDPGRIDWSKIRPGLRDEREELPRPIKIGTIAIEKKACFPTSWLGRAGWESSRLNHDLRITPRVVPDPGSTTAKNTFTTSGTSRSDITRPLAGLPVTVSDFLSKLNTCPQCRTMKKPSAAFCPTCGYDLASDRPVNKRCSHCRRYVKKSSEFCNKCGEAIGF